MKNDRTKSHIGTSMYSKKIEKELKKKREKTKIIHYGNTSTTTCPVNCFGDLPFSFLLQHLHDTILQALIDFSLGLGTLSSRVSLVFFSLPILLPPPSQTLPFGPCRRSRRYQPLVEISRHFICLPLFNPLLEHSFISLFPQVVIASCYQLLLHDIPGIRHLTRRTS
jgi:hypothetical protein